MVSSTTIDNENFINEVYSLSVWLVPHESGYFLNLILFSTNRPFVYTKPVNSETKTGRIVLKPLARAVLGFVHANLDRKYAIPKMSGFV